MKLTFLLVLCSLMTVSASVKSQDARVTLTMKETAISKVIRAIEKNTDYKFVYNSSVFPADTKVNVSVTDETVANLLNQILANTGFNFKLLGGGLIVLTQNQVTAGPIVITGSVIDENNQPLLGVNIKIKGQKTGATTTNEKGFFSIKLPDNNAVLEVSYIGYLTQEIIPGNSTTLNIKLKQALGALNEVVVVGYGTQSKATITAAVSQVSGADLVKVPGANLTQSLAGRLPGLIAYNTSGQPGADDATLLVRGLSTTNNSAPLIVIDGIVRSDISYMDPNDIESVSVLKDAAATAIYGARAANGAILVTTKRGTEGKTTITYSGNAGVQSAVQVLKPLDSYTTALMWNQAWTNEGAFAPDYYGTKGFNAAALAAIQNGTDPNRFGNTDWYKAVYGGTPTQQSHNVSINGGTTQSRYFLSAGYLDQNGLYDASLSRYNIRANLDGKIANIFDYTLNIAGRREIHDNVNGTPNNALEMSPLEPFQYTNGTYHYDPAWSGNPYLEGKGYGGYNDVTNDNFESSVTLSYKVPFIPGLSIKGLYSFDNYATYNKIWSTPYTTYQYNADNTFSVPASVSTALASLSETFGQSQSTTSEASLNYSHSFKLHNINALLLYTETRNSAQSITAGRINFPSPLLDQLTLGSTTGATNGSTATQSARRGVVSRLAYNYDQKYLFEFDSRYDGSDLFPPGHRYGFFPALSAGWRLSEESFIKDRLPFITNLKIRGSWGMAGNDSGGAFQYLSTYSIPTGSSYGFGGSAGQVLAPGVIPNPVFTWEKATTTDVGVDANLWKNLFGISADYFYKRTSNILATPASAVPVVLGGSLPIGNYGIVDNSGFEIELTHQNTIGAVSYYVRPNITFNHSKVISYPEAASTPSTLRLTGRQVQPTTLITGYVANGLYQNAAQITSGPTPLYAATQPGDIRYVDLNGDGKITASDKTIITNGSTPGTVAGLNAGASYKGFDFSVLFQGAADVNDVIPRALAWSMYGGIQIAYPLQQNYWTPSNPGATFPRLTVTSKDNQDNSTYWVRNGSYLRMKSFELGYTLPKAWLSKLSISDTHIFVNGTNLFTLSHLRGIMDPETGVYNYPLMRVFNVGLTVKFN